MGTPWLIASEETNANTASIQEDILFSVGSISASSVIGISPGCLNTAVLVSAS
jgi:hypothetical protein